MTQILPSFAVYAATLLATAAVIAQPPERALRFGPQDEQRPVTAVAQPSESRAATTNSADRLLADMLSNLKSRKSISARLRQKVDVLGQELVGTGLYLQQGRGDDIKVRLELNLQVSGEATSVQQIYDGMYLWLHNDLLDKTTLSRIDVRRVKDAMDDRDGRRRPIDQALLTLCGLPKLLESIAESFEFRIVQQDRLNGVPIYVLRGTWRPAALAATYPDTKASSSNGKDAPPVAGKLPAHAPEVVVLLVGREDLFPYRIEFRRRVQADEQTPKRTDTTAPLVIMDLFEVALDTPIDELQFVYRPGDIKPIDGTNKLLVQMGLAEAE